MRTPDYQSLQIQRETANLARDALATFLSARSWDCFVTATFATRQRYPFTAIQRVARALDITEPSIYPAFLCAEQHKLEGAYHVHGLVRYGEFVDRQIDTFKTNLDRIGFNRLESIASVGGVSGYISKYLLKSDDRAEYQVFGVAPVWR